MSYTGAAMNVQTKPAEDAATIVAELGARAK